MITTDQGLILPDATDNRNVPLSFSDLVLSGLESRLVKRYESVTDRALRNPSPAEGELSYLKDLDRIDMYTGAAWVVPYPQTLSRHVSSTAGGTGVTTTETKDASGDLTFVAVSGYSYTILYNATAIAGAANHLIDVNVRDGGGSSPTNGSTRLTGTTETMINAGVGGRVGIHIAEVFDCPGDLAAGTHVIAVFYVRNANGAATNVVQLENAGPRRQLSVTGVQTN